MNFSDLFSSNNLKHGLCTIIIVALLSYIIPAVLPKDESNNEMLNKMNAVFKSIQDSPIPILIVVFVGCIVSGMVCGAETAQ